MLNCKITETQGELIKELNKKILKTATLYGKQKREKKKK